MIKRRSGTDAERGPRIFQVIMKNGWMVVLVVTLGFNIHLIRERRSVPTTRPTLELGTLLEPVQVVEWGSERSYRLDFAGGDMPTLIYGFSPLCGWCWRNEPNVLALQSCLADTHRFIAVTSVTSGMEEFFEGEVPPYQVLIDVDGEFRRAAHLVATPTMLLVDMDGKVTDVWRGALQNDLARAVEDRLHCILPGLREPRSPIR